MDRKVYFGNDQKQVWIDAPRTGLNASSQSYYNESQLLNGRTHINRSRGSHRRFNANWLGSLNASTLENSLQTIKDFADGIYGDGPFYWVDPYAINMNLLPPHWAAPGLQQQSWPQLWDVAPFEYVSTASNLLNYPATSARYSSGSTDEQDSTKKLTLIIPDGYTLYFGWHGAVASGSAGVRIDRYRRNDGTVESVDPDVISVTSSNRTNTIISGTVYSKVDIYFYNPAGADYDFTVAGMIAQILKGTNYPEAGGFISGRGTTGLEFSNSVNLEYYSANINEGQVGLSTQWIEV